MSEVSAISCQRAKVIIRQDARVLSMYCYKYSVQCGNVRQHAWLV